MTQQPQPRPVPRTPLDSQLRQALHARGQRCTPARLDVLHALTQSRDHLPVAELQSRISRDDRRYDTTTVYRTVTALQALGLIHEIAVVGHPTRYGLTSPPHHHAICTCFPSLSRVRSTIPVSSFGPRSLTLT